MSQNSAADFCVGCVCRGKAVPLRDRCQDVERAADEELDMDMEHNMLSEHLNIHVHVYLWVQFQLIASPHILLSSVQLTPVHLKTVMQLRAYMWLMSFM